MIFTSKHKIPIPEVDLLTYILGMYLLFDLWI